LGNSLEPLAILRHGGFSGLRDSRFAGVRLSSLDNDPENSGDRSEQRKRPRN
jgi:hypothetical protein